MEKLGRSDSRMTITLNGNTHPLAHPLSVAELLAVVQLSAAGTELQAGTEPVSPLPLPYALPD